MRYYKQLDALRCYAALWVLIGHFPIFTLPKAIKSFADYIPGVQLFFCISGFLITGIILENNKVNAKQFFKAFYFRRFLRIFPIYYFAILFLAIINPENYRSSWLLTDLLYLSNIRIGILGDFQYNLVSPHFWSLAVEEQFYLLWPGLLFFLRKKWQTSLLATVLILTGVLFSINYENSFLVMRTISSLSYLGSGCLIAILIDNNNIDLANKTTKIFAGGLFSLAMLFVIAICVLDTKISKEFSYLLTVLIIPIIVFRFAIGFEGKFFSLILENKVVLYLGKISYGIYVYHMLALYPYLGLKEVFGSVLPESSVVINLIKYTLTIVISALSWELFESKINRLKAKFQYKD